MHLFIVRHGQTDWNVQRRIQGQTDIELNDIGKKQSRQLVNILSTYPIQTIISSDLLRCKYTTEQLKEKTGLPVEYTPLLRERYYGDWEGKHADEFFKFIFDHSIDKNGHYDPSYVPLTVEPLQDLWNRCEQIYNKIKNLETNTLLITHGGTKGMLLSLLLKGNPHSSHSYGFNNTALTELQRYSHPTFSETHKKENIIFRLLRYNCTNHLSDTE